MNDLPIVIDAEYFKVTEILEKIVAYNIIRVHIDEPQSPSFHRSEA